MSPQGEPTHAPDDDWWDKLYGGDPDQSGDRADPAEPPSSPSAGSPRPEPRPPAPWEEAAHERRTPRTFPGAPPGPGVPPPQAPAGVPRPRTAHVGDGPPTYDPEPTALPAAHPDELDQLTADTVLDGARYGPCTLRAASVRGDSARYRGEQRRDALLTARFGTGEGALLLVAVATGGRTATGAHRAAADVSRWIAEAVGRSHARLSEDIRSGRRRDLKSGLHRLTDRSYGRLRGRAADLGVPAEAYTAGLRCLLLTADPACRTRVFFGVGDGGLFRLRDGFWQDIEPPVPPLPPPDKDRATPPPGAADVPAETAEGERLTLDLGLTPPPAGYLPGPVQPPPEPFRFRASVARPGDVLLLAGRGLAEPVRGEPALADELAARWGTGAPPGLAAFLADTQLRVKGYADDRTCAAVWEA
ncbi:protein phosphatase 2C domain-containing protein [Streptomyces lichenis]|uniref:Protein phosphatase 2C domain-containing protein n=2 Tax=Streptomyces lichenis TaxID=2306967 RepID=A0ABT0IBG6_9ACTN|nr:protein phosphatase 2C domain-containing protein [Streptomyces lichenis]MCK8678653.1 protein phosphatase 2C domain-containing protein [Streptomyces lichenis]